MSQASQDITQQFKDGGVIPGQLNGQNAVSKTYVDTQDAIRDVNISAVAGSASVAQASINNHIVSPSAHPAQNITYSGEVIGATNIKQAIDIEKRRTDTIVAQSGTDITELVDARGIYPVLSARLNANDAQLADNLKVKEITSASGNVHKNSLLSHTKITPYWDGNLPGPYNSEVLEEEWRPGVDNSNTVFSTLYIEENYDLSQPNTDIFSDPSKTPDAVSGITARVTVNGNSNERAPAGESFAIGGLIESDEKNTSLYGLWGSVKHNNIDGAGTVRLQGAETNVVTKSDFTPVGGTDVGGYLERSAYGFWTTAQSVVGAATAAFGFGGKFAYGLLGKNGVITRAFLHFPTQVGGVSAEAGNMGRQDTGGTIGDTIYSPVSALMSPKVCIGDGSGNTYVLKMNGSDAELIRNGATNGNKLNKHDGTIVVALAGGVSQEITVPIPVGIFGSVPVCGIIQGAEDTPIYGSYKLSASTSTSAVFIVRKFDGTALPSGSVRFSFYLS